MIYIVLGKSENEVNRIMKRQLWQLLEIHR